jgi:hypothetical protein
MLMTAEFVVFDLISSDPVLILRNSYVPGLRIKVLSAFVASAILIWIALALGLLMPMDLMETAGSLENGLAKFPVDASAVKSRSRVGMVDRLFHRLGSTMRAVYPTRWMILFVVRTPCGFVPTVDGNVSVDTDLTKTEFVSLLTVTTIRVPDAGPSCILSFEIVIEDHPPALLTTPPDCGMSMTPPADQIEMAAVTVYAEAR